MRKLRLKYNNPNINNVANYSAFGMQMKGRTYSVGDAYRLGFNGKEKVDEINGEGNIYDYGFRIYNPRIGKFLSVDPMSDSYPWYTPYQFAGNKPIESIDIDGLEEISTKEVLSRIWKGEPEIKKVSEWHFDNRFEDPGNLDKPFAKASSFNTLNNNYNLYKNVAERHAYYLWAQSKINSSQFAGNSQWFGAAALVTGWFGVGGAEMPDFGSITSDATDKFLIGGNEYLFKKNMANMKGLMEGNLNIEFTTADNKTQTLKGKKGKELDYALVEFEQSAVQEYMNMFKATNPNADMNKIMKEINSSMNYAEDLVQQVIKENFTNKNGEITFDFSKYKDREKLGKKIVDKLHESNSSKK